MRWSLVALLTVLMAALLPVPAVAETGTRTYTGTIDGAEYLVEVPGDWNGTLVLFSHGYQVVKDLFTWNDKEMPPAFATYTPATFQRPSW